MLLPESGRWVFESCGGVVEEVTHAGVVCVMEKEVGCDRRATDNSGRLHARARALTTDIVMRLATR